jgi:hypothetical protein
MTVILHPLYSPDLAPYDFSLFVLLKIKLKGRHHDTAEAIEAESQAVLNTLTEYDFMDAFTKMAEALGTVHMHGKGLFQGPKLVLDEITAQVPEIMDTISFSHNEY